MKTNSSFSRAARRTVLNPVAFESLNVAAVHAHRNIHMQNPLWMFDHVANIGAQVECVRRKIEIFHGRVISGFDSLS